MCYTKECWCFCCVEYTLLGGLLATVVYSFLKPVFDSLTKPSIEESSNPYVYSVRVMVTVEALRMLPLLSWAVGGMPPFCTFYVSSFLAFVLKKIIYCYWYIFTVNKNMDSHYILLPCFLIYKAVTSLYLGIVYYVPVISNDKIN